jgi:hypothetical protein
MANGTMFLGIPTTKGLIVAAVVIVVFMAAGGGLYCFAEKPFKDYALKVGDCFIQGAIIALLFGILKQVIDGQKFIDLFRKKGSASENAGQK